MAFDRAYYEKQYRNYDRQNPGRKMLFYRSLAERAAAGRPCPRILDVGCAFGHFLRSLPERWERYGIDASDYAIARAREEVPGTRFAVAGPDQSPFAGDFDVITAFDVLEHIPELDGVARWIASQQRPGGGLVFVVPVYDGPSGPFIRALDRDTSHVHKQSRDFWLRWAVESHLLVDWWGICRYLLPGGCYVHAVTRRFRRWTPAIACLMRRL